MTKKWSIILGLALCAAFLFAGCQPTPEEKAVINKRQDIPDGAVLQEGGAAADDTDFTAPVAYKKTGHWQEDVQKDEYFTVNADADIMMPEVSAYPVEKLGRLDMTQEKADELIAYFVPAGTKFYQLPLRTTKAEYEAQILDAKKNLAQVEAGGDGEDAESMRSYIAELEQKWADAPEQEEKKEADTKFTYYRDYETGEPRTEDGENTINIGADGDGGVMKSIYVSRSDGKDANVYFSYDECFYEVESTTLMQEEDNRKERERAEGYDEPYKSESLAELAEQDQRVQELKDRYAQNDLDLAAMQEKAIGILKELGIKDMQVTKCEKALYSPETQNRSSMTYQYTTPDQPGCYIEFKRECGGIPCETQGGGHWGPGMSMDGMYSAPYYPERGSIMLDEHGNIRSFMWSDCAQIVETVAQDSKILSFDEIKDRAVDHLYWNNTDHYDDGSADKPPRPKLRFEVEEVRLIMTYINVKDEPDRVMAVPAWYIGAQGYAAYPGDDGTPAGETEYNKDEIIINALDGSPILMPGVQRIMEDMKAEMGA